MLYSKKIIFILICIVSPIFVVSQKSNRLQEDVYNQCITIKEPVCQGLQYAQTKMPNLVGIANQEDSAKRLRDYFPLINADCSHYFRFFLCTIYFPMCSDALGSPSVLLPCNSLCLYIQSRCEPYLRAFQLQWPAELSCHKFPKNSIMCIQPKNYNLDSNKRKLDPSEIDQFKRSYPNWNAVIHSTVNDPKPMKPIKQIDDTRKSPGNCLPPFAPLPFHLSTRNYSQASLCLLRCDANLLYNSSDKQLAKAWLLVWAVCGLISSFVAIAAFLFDRKSRFKYPERPIVFIVICYGCLCVFYLIQLSLGTKKMICKALQSNPDEFVIVREGVEGPLCTLMFLGTYYFEMAAAVWWVMLAVSCYLASARKWSSEGLERIGNIMHMVCWMTPALKATVILIIHKIDADELLGMCYVGRQNSSSNLIFVLIPRIMYFSIGVVLLMLSFRSLLLLRTNLTQPELKQFLDGLQNQQSLDRFIVKTGIFCGVYGIPIICYISCQFYYYFNIEKWNSIVNVLGLKKPRCLSKLGLRWSDSSCTYALALPLTEVRLLEVFSSLVIGITSAMWMWCNKKTFITFYEIFIRKTPCYGLSKQKPTTDILMTNSPQYCYKNVNTSISTETNQYQYSDFNNSRSKARQCNINNPNTVCYNANMIICSV